VKSDGTPCTTRSGERANSGAPPVLVAFGDYDAMRLRQPVRVDGKMIKVARLRITNAGRSAIEGRAP